MCSEYFNLRLRAVEYLIQSANQLQVTPIVKYSALSFFADRFYPSIFKSREGNGKRNWLLEPIEESNLQLFALVSIWIASKIHSSVPLSVNILKSLGDKTITEQHFTTRDFIEAVLNFEIGTTQIAFVLLDELFTMLNGVAKVGEFLNFEACMDVMDLLYENEEILNSFCSPSSLAAAILVVSYIITVPKQRWEFPVLPWVKFITSGNEEHIMESCRSVCEHIFKPL